VKQLHYGGGIYTAENRFCPECASPGAEIESVELKNCGMERADLGGHEPIPQLAATRLFKQLTGLRSFALEYTMRDEQCETYIVQTLINALASACANQLRSLVLTRGGPVPYTQLLLPLRSLRSFTSMRTRTAHEHAPACRSY
jgi:hypothetical protein